MPRKPTERNLLSTMRGLIPFPPGWLVEVRAACNNANPARNLLTRLMMSRRTDNWQGDVAGSNRNPCSGWVKHTKPRCDD